MTKEHRQAHANLLLGGEVDKPQNSRVRPAMQKRQCAEILIESDQHAAFSICQGQYLIVTRIFFPISGPNDIVTGG